LHFPFILFNYDRPAKTVYLYTINYIDVYHSVSVDKYLQDFQASFSLFVSSLKLRSKVRKKEKKYIKNIRNDVWSPMLRHGFAGQGKGEAGPEENSKFGASLTLQLLQV
jgi:hypothetical protein